jgi:hypothetical protein
MNLPLDWTQTEEQVSGKAGAENETWSFIPLSFDPVLNRIDSDSLASSLSSTGNMYTPLIEMVTNVLESRTRRIRDKLLLFLESQFKHVSAVK